MKVTHHFSGGSAFFERARRPPRFQRYSPLFESLGLKAQAIFGSALRASVKETDS